MLLFILNFIICSVIFFANDQVELITYENEDNPIHCCTDIPKIWTDFTHYCYDHHMTKNALYCIFKIRVGNVRNFHDLKKPMMPWLMANWIFISHTTLRSAKNCVIGWLSMSHHRATNRVSTVQEWKKTRHKHCFSISPQ